MFNIKTLNKISPAGLEIFDRTKYKYSDDIQNPDAIIVRSAAMHDIVFEPSVKAIARAGAGVNNIPIERCANEGIVVFNTPGANANAVKEMVLCGLLLSARRISAAIDWVKTIKNEGAEVPKLVEKGKSQFEGPELLGKKLGVIGLGAIGVLVANAARALGMDIYGYDPYLSVEAAWNLDKNVNHAKTLQEIYEKCDFITIHVPYMAETKNMINSESIKMMKDGVRIINFARGELVNTEDILEALKAGKVKCYVTDFPTAELIGVDGVVAIPHLAASTPESEDNCAKMAAKQLINFLENGNIKNSVNMPTVEMARQGEVRIAIIHKNVPAMISKASNVISDAGLNIDQLANSSKGEIGYSLYDVTGNFTDEIVAKLSKIEGIIRVNIYK